VKPERGWISTRDGNVSVAMSDRRGFLVSASGVIKHALVPSQFVFIPAGDAAAPAADAYPRPSGELDLHRRLQALLAGRALTCCTCTPPTSLLPSTRDGIWPSCRPTSPKSPATPGSGRTSRRCPTSRTGRSLRSRLPASSRPGPHILGLDRHGVVAVGKTPWEAFEHVERLEHICRIALAAGRRHIHHPDAIDEETGHVTRRL
jgi:L-fuculose-phosphate aldolase